MQAFLYRAIHVPSRHLAAALGLGAAIGIGFWVWTRTLPVDYETSALLSYETPHHFLDDVQRPDTEAPTARIADSIFTPAVLQAVAGRVQSASAGSGNSGRLHVAAETADGIRSHIELTQTAPGLLQVSYRGHDARQVEGTVNVLASTLAAWVATPSSASASQTTPAAPAPSFPATQQAIFTSRIADAPKPQAPTVAAVPATVVISTITHEQQHKAAELRHRATVLEENGATLTLQRQNIDAQIRALETEEKGLKHPAKASVAPGEGDEPRQQLERQLLTAKKRLAELRQNFSDGYPDVEAMKERVAVIEQRLSALPAPAGAIAPVHTSNASQPRVKTVASSLAQLRALRSTVASEEEQDRQQAEQLRQQAAGITETPGTAAFVASQPSAITPVKQPEHVVPAAFAAIPHDAASQQPVWLGHFTVLSWGGKPHQVSDDDRPQLAWLGAALALVLTGMYLALAAWRFRPVTNPASLQDGLPEGVKYLGAISGGPLTENPS